MNEITTINPDDYAKHDETVRAGHKTFLAVGRALVAINTGKLYLKEFSTFEEYTISRGIKRGQAYKIMSAVKTAMNLADVHRSEQSQVPVNDEDINRSSANALASLSKVPEGKQAEVFNLAAKQTGGAPTEKAIKQVADKVMRKKHSDPDERPAREHSALTGKRYSSVDELVADTCSPEVQAAYKALCDKPEVFTPGAFKSELEALETRANDAAVGDEKKRKEYGVIANELAGRLLNPLVKTKHNPYLS